MSSKVGIVYATQSGILRRVIFPDSDTSLSDGTHFVGAGETMLIAPLAEYNNAKSKADGTPQNQPEAQLFKTHTGKAWASGRCAVIDNTGLVVKTIHADPALDSINGMTLVSSDVALPGWTWTLQSGFVPSVSVSVPSINPAIISTT